MNVEAMDREFVKGLMDKTSNLVKKLSIFDYELTSNVLGYLDEFNRISFELLEEETLSSSLSSLLFTLKESVNNNEKAYCLLSSNEYDSDYYCECNDALDKIDDLIDKANEAIEMACNEFQIDWNGIDEDDIEEFNIDGISENCRERLIKEFEYSLMPEIDRKKLSMMSELAPVLINVFYYTPFLASNINIRNLLPVFRLFAVEDYCDERIDEIDSIINCYEREFEEDEDDIFDFNDLDY